ncbi:MAG: DUF1573 domain-containing protein [Alistipes sp.]|nr:DUF1573 domain-containing protein [Alistipes sp.]
MKKLLLIFSLFALSSSYAVASEPEQSLCFETTLFDFGTVVRENSTHTCRFLFENRGSEPVVVLGVQTSCSCLKAECSRRPIRQGETGEVLVRLEAAKVDEGIFHRVIKVQTNRGLYLLTVKGQSVSK